jgi:hypothetical protein
MRINNYLLTPLHGHEDIRPTCLYFYARREFSNNYLGSDKLRKGRAVAPRLSRFPSRLGLTTLLSQLTVPWTFDHEELHKELLMKGKTAEGIQRDLVEFKRARLLGYPPGLRCLGAMCWPSLLPFKHIVVRLPLGGGGRKGKGKSPYIIFDCNVLIW